MDRGFKSSGRRAEMWIARIQPVALTGGIEIPRTRAPI